MKMRVLYNEDHAIINLVSVTKIVLWRKSQPCLYATGGRYLQVENLKITFQIHNTCTRSMK